MDRPICQDGSASSQPVCVQVINGETFQALQIQNMSSNRTVIAPNLNVGDMNPRSKENIDSRNFITGSHILKSSNDFQENVLTVPIQFVQLEQNSSFFSNLPEGTQMQFDVYRKRGKLNSSEGTDLPMESTGQMIISYNEGDTKNYLLDHGNMSMLISENDTTFAKDKINEDSYEEDSGPMSGQLMVAKLVKEYDEIDDKIPDSRTITIDNNNDANIIVKSESEISRASVEFPGRHLICFKCHISFKKQAEYKKHCKKHEEDRPFQCPHCIESFNFEKNLNLHVSLHSTGELKCPECGKEFRRVASFKCHLALHKEEEIVTCKICDEDFVTMYQLNVHQQEKHNHLGPQFDFINFQEIESSLNMEGSMSCQKCGTSFVSLEQLKNHIVHAHPEDNQLKNIQQKKQLGNIKGVFSCSKCSAYYTSPMQLNNHVLHKHLRPTLKPKRTNIDRTLYNKICQECGKSFLKPSQLLRHMRIHTGERPFKCTFLGCGRAFNQRSTLIIHSDIHSGQKSYVCPLCSKAFVQKSNLRGHIKRVHPVTKGTDPLFSCFECTCVFKKANSLNAHISRAHMTDTTVESDKNDEYKALMMQLQELEGQASNQDGHIEKENLRTHSSLGSKNVVKSSVLKPIGISEDILHLAVKNSGLLQVKNRLCKDANYDKNKVQKVKIMTVIEKIQEGAIKRYPVLVRIQDNTKWYVCDYEGCTKEFKKPSDLVRHIRIHTNEKPYQCKMCQRSFSIKATLVGHMKTHLVGRDYPCTICEKQFTTATSLKTHSGVHTGLKPYKCSICSKSFRTISQRKAHILSHTQSAYRMYTLKRKAMPLPDIPLQEPILITRQGPVKLTSRYKNVYTDCGHATGDRPHICHFCSGAFKKSSHLKQHERTHTGEKPFKCELCMKAFGSRSVLKSHFKVHTGARNYSCNVCSKGFASRGSLNRHFSTHSAERPYLCPYCHKTFKTNTNCKKHMKVHKLELAMEAIRTAGENLQDDSEQALLTTTSVFGNQTPNETQEVSLRIDDISPCDQGSQDSIVTLSNSRNLDSIITSTSEASKIMNTDLQELSKCSKESENGPESPIEIHYTQDLLNGSFTLTNFQHKSSQNPLVTSQMMSLNQNSVVSSQSSMLATVSHSQSDIEGEQPLNHMYWSQNGILYGNIENISLEQETRSPVQAFTKKHTVLQQSNLIESVHSSPTTSNCNSNNSITNNTSYSIPTSIEANHLSKQETHWDLQRTESYSGDDGQLHIDTSKKSLDLANKEPIEQVFELSSPTEVAVHKEKTTDEDEHFKDTETLNVNDVMDKENLSTNKELPVQSEGNLYSNLAVQPVLIQTKGLPLRPISDQEAESSETLVNSEIFGDAEILNKTSKKKPKINVQENLKKSSEMSPITMEIFEENTEKRTETILKPRAYTCSECGKSYQKQHHLKIHLKWHSTPATCKLCGETFPNSTVLKGHTQIHKRKTCNDCKMQFLTPLDLINHNKKVHSKVPKSQTDAIGGSDRNLWHCPVCLSIFNNCKATEEHLFSHSQEEISLAIANERKHDLDLATSTNDSRMKLAITSEAVDQLLQEAEKTNENSKSGSGQSKFREFSTVNESANQCLPHQCSLCLKSFKKPSDLTRHIRTHTGEKPYECTTCQKKFAVKSTLDVHTRIHTGKKEYKCITCKTLYSSKGSLKVHMRLHTGAKPLKCCYCGMKFRTSGHRKAHIAKHFKLKDTHFTKTEVPIVIKNDPMFIGPHALYVASQDNLLETTDEANDEINSVMINSDGTVTLQLNGVSLNGLEPSTILNLQQLSDSVFDQLQFCNTESVQIQSSSIVEEAVEVDTISVNPNSVMTMREGTCDDLQSDLDDNRQLEVDLDRDHKIIVLHNDNMDSRKESIKFAGSKDLEERIKLNGLDLKCPPANQNAELYDKITIKNKNNARASEKNEYGKVKMWRCPYPNCPMSFQSEKNYNFHMNSIHNLNYECSECKEVFLSQSSLQHHLYTEHCGPKSFQCTNCRQNFHTKDEFVQHTTKGRCQCPMLIQTESVFSQKSVCVKQSSDDRNSAGRIVLVDNGRESLDEDSEPLMIGDIFLSQ